MICQACKYDSDSYYGENVDFKYFKLVNIFIESSAIEFYGCPVCGTLRIEVK